MEEHRKERVYAYCGHCGTQTPVIAVSTHEADVYVNVTEGDAISYPFEENDIDTSVEYVCGCCHSFLYDNTEDLYQQLLDTNKIRAVNASSESSDRYIDALMDFCKLVDHGSFVNKGSAFDKSHEGSIWFSGEGGTTIDGEYPIWQTPNSDYIIHPEFQKFMDKHDMFVEWYDAGTPFLYFK